jgi:putative DNA primase/helicase
MAKAPLAKYFTREELASMNDAFRRALNDYIDDVKDALCDDLVGLFDDLLGEKRKNRSAREAKYFGVSGNKVVAVILRGSKRGSWFDHSIQKGGGPLEAIRHYLGLATFKDTLDEAADRCAVARFEWEGVRAEIGAKAIAEREEKRRKKEAEREARRATEAAEAAREDAAKFAEARAKWNEGVPVAGTLGEKYLREERKIDWRDRAWPASMRWLEKERALIFAVTNAAGEIVGAQTEGVTRDGKQDKLRHGPKIGARMSIGRVGLGSVKFPGNPKGPIAFAEGAQTGLSTCLATGFETRVMLGSSGFARIINEAPKDRLILLCRDDDETSKTSYRSAVAAIYSLANAGHTVWDVWAYDQRRFTGADFNDLLQESGLAAVKDRFDKALEQRLNIGRVEHSLDKAGAILDQHIFDFFEQIKSDKSPSKITLAIGVDTAGGKTHFAIRHLVQYVLWLRSQGDCRPVIFLVPEHRLSDEIVARIKAEVLRAKSKKKLVVESYRGMGARKPGATSDFDKMCERFEDEMKPAQAMLVDVEKELCKPCPFRTSCAYRAQQTLQADIWVGAHPLLFNQAPSVINPKDEITGQRAGVAAVIIDEDVVAAGLTDGFVLPVDIFDDGQMPLPEGEQAAADLLKFRRTVRDILRAAPNGQFLRREDVEGRLDWLQCDEAARAEYDRKLTVKTEADWRDRGANRTIKKVAAAYHGFRELAAYYFKSHPESAPPEVSGSVFVDRKEDGTKIIRVRRRLDVHSDWRAPTLILDANLYRDQDVDALRRFFPRVAFTGRINIAAPHQRITQVVNRSYSLGYLAPPKKKKGAEADTDDRPEAPDDEDAGAGPGIGSKAKANASHRRDVEAAVVRTARQNGGMTLVIANKDVAAAFKFPPGLDIRVAHFGAMAGRDEWKAARTVFVVGRPLLSPRDAELAAAALIGRGVEILGKGDGRKGRRSTWYQRDRDYRLCRDGRGAYRVPCEVDIHPDPAVEAWRWRSCVAAIMQAAGRGRGPHKTADSPLDIVIMTDVCLPVPVDQFILAQDIEPTVDDLQMAAAGIAFENSASASAAFPNLWPTKDAFEKAVLREGEAGAGPVANCAFLETAPTFPYKRQYTELSAPISKSSNLRVAFKLARKNHREQFATVDLAICRDPRQFIEERIGPINWLLIEGQPEHAQHLPIAIGAEDLSLAPNPAKQARVIYVEIEDGLALKGRPMTLAKLTDPASTLAAIFGPEGPVSPRRARFVCNGIVMAEIKETIGFGSAVIANDNGADPVRRSRLAAVRR